MRRIRIEKQLHTYALGAQVSCCLGKKPCASAGSEITTKVSSPRRAGFVQLGSFNQRNFPLPPSHLQKGQGKKAKARAVRSVRRPPALVVCWLLVLLQLLISSKPCFPRPL